mgnify:FL=1|tara:strand:+ start:64 stop:309 length:246 start_codon:yes stop_codon:yes gene_type:complete
MLSCLCLIYADRKNSKAKKDPTKKLMNKKSGNGAEYFWKYRSTSIDRGLNIVIVIDKASNDNVTKNIKTLNIVIYYIILLG